MRREMQVTINLRKMVEAMQNRLMYIIILLFVSGDYSRVVSWSLCISEKDRSTKNTFLKLIEL